MSNGRKLWVLFVLAVWGGVYLYHKAADVNERLALGWCAQPVSLEQAQKAMEEGLNYDNVSGCILDAEPPAKPAVLAAAPAVAAPPPAAPQAQTLADARRGFVTALSLPPRPPQPLPTPPASLFVRADYASGPHTMPAFVTPDPKDGKRHAAIIWIGGGDLDGLGDFYTAGEPDNDESASPLRDAGVMMMFVTLRGSGNNASRPEYFLGEVDDILAAAEHLARLPYVDPARIYLGGHSTGGTLALLVAQSSARFKAVFALGPAESIKGYPSSIVPLVVNNMGDMEARLRSPIHWMAGIASPTYLIEGLDAPGNSDALEALCRDRRNPMLHCLAVPGKNHFSVIHPALKVIGARIAIPVPGQAFALQASDIAQRQAP